MTAPADIQPTEPSAAKPAETHAFQADVARLLHLMVHSVYSDRDIFLRELISNAADACEKLRYEALANPQLAGEGAGYAISVTLDKDQRTIVVADNGIGMDHGDLVGALGTIASSGTRAFLDRLAGEAPSGDDGAAPKSGADLIGQFGIGFYSAFMVADTVVVETRRAGGQEAWRWTSDGKGAYAISALPLEEAPERGTRVILHINEASSDYLESWRLEGIVRDHSGAVAVPIDLVAKPGDEPRRLTDGAALWAKPKSAVTTEEYTEFYRTLASQFDEPALTIHWRAEGRHEYSVLAFVPGSRPLDLFEPTRKGRAKLYVRRVLITGEADLLPGWLRFVRLVVDSADIPLNVSREMIQDSPVFAAIRKGVTNRILQELTKTAEADPDAWAKIWENFGAVLKEGLYEDAERRDALYKFARFTTSAHADGRRSLADYVKDLRENQTAIYYITGDDAKRLAASPQLEGFAARGIEVLILSDPVDAFWVSTAAGFDGKPFRSVTQGAADIAAVPLKEGVAPVATTPEPEVATLFAFVKQTLGDAVADVRASQRLSESAACLIAPEHGPDRRLERMLAQHGQLQEAAKPVLELNPTHAMVAALSARLKSGGDRTLVEDAAWLILDEARLADGDAPLDARAFGARLARVLAQAAT